LRRRAFLALFGLASLVACNVISGAADLQICAGAECDAGVPVPDRVEDAGSVVEAGPDGALPPTCSEGQSACSGKTAASCTGGAWKTELCPQMCVDGKCQPYASCRNASGDGCGATPTSCCATAKLPGGAFLRDGNASTPATIGAVDLELYEVTVGRFRAFVASGGGTKASPPAVGSGAHPKNPGSGWDATWNAYLPADSAALANSLGGGNATWTQAAGANEHKPINRVPWLLAFAFCAWDGARLPTAAEWAFAGYGGSDQRVYPWSVPSSATTITSSRAAYDCAYSPPSRSCSTTCIDGSACDANCVIGCNTSCSGCSSADIAPVGVLPTGVGKFGHFDLAGNVAEMTMDLAPPAPVITPCTDCVQFLTGDPKTAGLGSWGGKGGRNAELVVFGGGWNDATNDLRTSTANKITYSNASDSVGFRCARD